MTTKNGTKQDRKEKRKHKKSILRVDFTPMVDMNMLLITFFMFCTTLAKPQLMDLVMPTKVNGIESGKVPALRTTTLFLGENNKIYYFFGKPKYAEKGLTTEIKETDYSSEGLRKVLLEKNQLVIAKIKKLTEQKRNKEITEEQFKEATENIKSSIESEVVIIKPLNTSEYKDLVNTLDEVRICNISKYAVIDPIQADQEWINEYKQSKQIAQNNR